MGYKFRPSWFPTIVTLLLLPVLVSLGYWQLDRAEQKSHLQAEYDRKAQGAPIALDAAPRTAEELRFHKVMVRGEYEPEHQILLDNRIHQGKAGYHVITPLRIGSSEMRVLINRGWIPMGDDRRELPAAPAPAGTQQAVGIATVPSESVFTLGKGQDEGQWQSVWQHMDMQRYSGLVPFSMQPIVVLLDPASPGGFTRHWARLDAGIATHQGYAFQWFALAVALATIYFIVNFRKIPNDRFQN